MKLITPDRTKLKFGDYMSQALVYTKLGIIPPKVNKYKYINDLICSQLN